MQVVLTPTIKRPRIVVWMPDSTTKQKLTQLCHKLGIPRTNAPPFHCTIIYSKNGKPARGIVKPFTAFPVTVATRAMKYRMLGRKRDVLTIELDSDAIKLRNRQYMAAGAISDFPRFSAHVSLSNWETPYKGKIPKVLPDFQIVFDREVDWEFVRENRDEPVEGGPKDL